MEPVIQDTKQRYDDLPYSSFPYMHSAPEQIAAVASMFGMPSPDTATARVLELGCASGGNLIPFALRNPRAQAVGVDISEVQIQQARAYASRLGLDNISLLDADLQQLDLTKLGQFDYIVAHGVYSWVPPEIQEALLRLIAQCLAPHGVAYVSYNTYPGWKAKEILRDAMRMHAGVRSSASEQVAYGRAMVGFLQKVALKGSLVAAALNESVGQIMASPIDYVAHEFLEPYNLPCYFHEFVARVGQHGLSYLGEAQPAMMMPSSYHPELAQQLYGALGEDQVRVEQYLDFAISRVFRQTLLLRSERAATLRWQLDQQATHRLNYSARMTCADGEIKLDGMPQTFVAPPSTGNVSVGLSGIKQAIDLLGRTWPGTITRDELLRHAELTQGDNDPVSTEVLGEGIDELLEMMVLRGMARAWLDPVAAGTDPESLEIDPTVRRQAAALTPAQTHVANLWHDTVDIDAVDRLLFPIMDGTKTREELIAIVKSALVDGSLRIKAEQPADPDVRAAALVDAMRAKLRDSALLKRPV
jgi:SAM-dependent methyltransferase